MPDDNELRLREKVSKHVSESPVIDSAWDDAFVIGGERREADGVWVGGRVVCHFGDCEEYYPTEGCSPDPADARRIEVAWNCHDELVEACRAAQQVFGELLGIPGTPEQHTARDLIDAILTKAQEGQVARGDTECPPTASAEETSPAKQ